MAKINKELETPKKFERVYEDEREIITWKYDYSKFTNGPVSVEIKSKYAEVVSKKKKPKKQKERFNRFF
jgi:hypothetical protein